MYFELSGGSNKRGWPMVARFTWLIDAVVVGVVICLVLWFAARIAVWIKGRVK